MSQKNIFIIVVALFVVIFAGLLYENKRKEDRNSSNTIEKTSDFTQADNSQTVSGKIFFQKNNDGSSKIISYDLGAKENKIIYSDQDEDFKLTSLGSFAYLTEEYFVLQKKDNQNQIALIKISDVGNKEIVFDFFLSPESIGVSPDGQTIFYSTAQTSNGLKKHFLYQINRDGRNLRQIYTDDQTINNISSNKNGNKISFILGQTKIIHLDLDSLKQKELYHSSINIYSLVWHENGNLIFSEIKDKKTYSGKILSINENGDLKKVLETKKDFPDGAVVSPDFLATAYDLKNFTETPGGYKSDKEGEINFTLIGETNLNQIGSGIKVLAWIK